MGWIPGSTGQKCERIRLWSQLVNMSDNRVSKFFSVLKSQNYSCEAELHAVVLGGSTATYVLE